MDKRKDGNQNTFEFIKHSRNYLSASLLQNLLVVLSVPIFTNLLQPEEYGILSIFTLLVNLLTIIFGLNLKGGIFRYYFEQEGDFSKSLYSNIVFIVLFDAVIFLLIVAMKSQIAKFFSIDEHVLFLASAAAVFAVPLEMYFAYLQCSKQSMQFSYISVGRSFFVLAISVVFMFYLFDKKYLGKMYGEIIVSAFIALYAFRCMLKLTQSSFDTKYLKYTLRYSLPLIPHALSRFVLGYFDRIQINQLLTPVETGIYSFAYDVGMAMDVVVMASIKAWNPIFLEKYSQKEYSNIEALSKTYAGYICAAAMIIVLFSKEVVTILAPEKYYEAVYLVPVIVMGYFFVFLYLMYFQYASYQKRTELIAIGSVSAGAVNVGLNYLLIPIYGYVAAAVTTMISYGLLFFFHYFNARFILKENIMPVRRFFPPLLALTAFIVFFELITNVIDNYPLLLSVKFTIFFCVLYIFVFRRKKGAV